MAPSLRRLAVAVLVAVVLTLAATASLAWLTGVRFGSGVDPVAERALAERLVGRPLPAFAHDVSISHDAGIDTIVFVRFTAPQGDADAFFSAVVEGQVPDACVNRWFDAEEAERLDMPEIVPPCTPFHEFTCPSSGVTIRMMRLQEPGDEATVRFVAFTQ